MWKSSKRKSLYNLDHDSRSNDIYPSESIEKMLWPSFHEFPKYKKIDEAGVNIGNGVRAIIIAIEMM